MACASRQAPHIKGGTNELKIDEKQLTGTGLKLFRIWLYTPFPLAFLILAGLMLISPRFDLISLGFVFASLVLAYAYYLFVRRIERKLGHSNLAVGTTIAGFCLAVMMAIGIPLGSHWFSLRRGMPHDFHFEMCFIILGIVPILLMGIKIPVPSK